jgi:ABC-type nitrate/sulfonate/bicarbonate transport system substrate-binding protein
MTTFRIGSVPEHFTMPFHLAMGDGAFAEAGIQVEWTDYPGGTGQMCKALRDKEVDICALLTEGAVSDISQGNPSKLIGVFVASPIRWGIYTGAESALDRSSDIFQQRIAISRFGSGSHLIPQVDALMKEKKSITSEQFVVVGDVHGGLAALNRDQADIFYWEHVTTRPYEKQGLVKKLGLFITPWPSFVLAAREEVLHEHPETVQRFQEILYGYSRRFMSTEAYIPEVAQRFQLSERSVESWFHSTAWTDHPMISPKMVSNVEYALKETGILESALAYKDLVWEPSQVVN